MPVEEPCLGVEARRSVVIGDPHLGTETVQELDGLHLGSPHVRGREHAQRPPEGAVSLDERAELVETGELNEGAEEVDAIGARELAREVREHAIATGVGDEAGGEERAARPMGGSGPDTRGSLRDASQQAIHQRDLACPEVPLASELPQQTARHPDLLLGVRSRLDGDPGGVADQRHELLVDIGVLPDLGDVDGMRVLEFPEARLQGLGNDLVVDASGEGGRRAAPDGHGSRSDGCWYSYHVATMAGSLPTRTPNSAPLRYDGVA